MIDAKGVIDARHRGAYAGRGQARIAPVAAMAPSIANVLMRYGIGPKRHTFNCFDTVPVSRDLGKQSSHALNAYQP